MKKTILLSCISLMAVFQQLSAQNFTISGNIKNASGAAIGSATVQLDKTNNTVTADAWGAYQLKDVKPASYTIKVTAVGYKVLNRGIKISGDAVINMILDTAVNQLTTVTIKDKKQQTFGITRLRAVEGTTINAGKKSEVIVLDDVTANKSTNNTRQIYSKIAGLNIWENDGAGIQLGIGGRGLNPNRVTNFNTRQNGYDMSADALGYPESYYSPPTELTDRIEILRGASSLQYGTQFGGLINFKLKEGSTEKPIEITARETAGSWGFFNTSTSIGGTVGKVQYYTFYQHKTGDGWRPNSTFNVNTAYGALTYHANDKLAITFQYTHMDYLAHQPGGLTDDEFYANAQQSVRQRNWFKVQWNLGAAIFDYKINDNLKFNSRFFGLSAGRDAVGDLDYVNRDDNGADRTLYVDTYKNYGNESRLLYSYKLGNDLQNLLVGFRYYHGHTNRQQGMGNNGSTGTPADFEYNFSPTEAPRYSKYDFPEHNISVFAENIFRLTPKFSIIPGVRFESINTSADGNYDIANYDGSGTLIYDQPTHDVRSSNRNFVIAGLGLSYTQSDAVQLYGNISQNYRAINFNDIHLLNTNKQVDPNLQDETGYSADMGVRGNVQSVFNYDVSVFFINYKNRIGNVQKVDSVSTPTHVATYNIYQYRTNVSQSRNLGLESFAELEVLHYFHPNLTDTRLSVFGNLALINARYVNSKEPAYQDKHVEVAPDVIFKSGLTFHHKSFTGSYQVAYTSSQYADATNAVLPSPDALFGLIPSYTVMDLSVSYKLSRILTLEGSINNLADARYFTRRAESYPGPGIIPADARSYFLTLQVKL